MSNYHVEPADKPEALTNEAIKSLRKRAGPGHLAAAAPARRARRAGSALWLLEVTAGTIGFVWPNLAGRLRGADPDRRPRRPQAPELGPADRPRASRPTTRGARVRRPDRPGPAAFLAGEDTTGDGTALNVRALYQRCPHLGCKPNPCLKNFWLECPCHGSRYDRLGIKADGAQYGPAPREHGPLLDHGRRRGVLTINTGKITLGPLPVAARPARASSRRAPRRAASDGRTTPGAPSPSSACPVAAARRAEPAPVERFTLAAVGAHVRADAASAPPRSSASRRTPAGSASSPSVVVVLFVVVYWFYELGRRSGISRAAARRRGRAPSR